MLLVIKSVAFLLLSFRLRMKCKSCTEPEATPSPEAVITHKCSDRFPGLIAQSKEPGGLSVSREVRLSMSRQGGLCRGGAGGALALED